jgi:hypothetical protein
MKIGDKKKLSAFSSKLMGKVMTEFDGFLQQDNDLGVALPAIETGAVNAIYMLLWTAKHASQMMDSIRFEGKPVLLVKNAEHVSLTWQLPFERKDGYLKIRPIYEEHQKKIREWREKNSQFREVQIELKYYTQGPNNGPTSTYA